jgi:hypothetical protein
MTKQEPEPLIRGRKRGMLRTGAKRLSLTAACVR